MKTDVRLLDRNTRVVAAIDLHGIGNFMYEVQKAIMDHQAILVPMQGICDKKIRIWHKGKERFVEDSVLDGVAMQLLWQKLAFRQA